MMKSLMQHKSISQTPPSNVQQSDGQLYNYTSLCFLTVTNQPKTRLPSINSVPRTLVTIAVSPFSHCQADKCKQNKTYICSDIHIFDIQKVKYAQNCFGVVTEADSSN